MVFSTLPKQNVCFMVFFKETYSFRVLVSNLHVSGFLYFTNRIDEQHRNLFLWSFRCCETELEAGIPGFIAQLPLGGQKFLIANGEVGTGAGTEKGEVSYRTGPLVQL